ncbi:MAG: thioredoxin domain-containing protein [Chloroflexota bacterium]|jgi:uncharacterized protein YyaL (SSP411 family)
MPNHLVSENSPYLLQHAQNPVNWYPWGDEALTKAKVENKPIFLSIGYAACHWCHVMEKESFTDETTAQFLNRHFISIKVDREERPDLDNLYMSAVVSMTGQGGWPMSVFLTPGLKPFYGGTYFPPIPRHGMPSFLEVLQSVHRVWQSDREQIDSIAEKISQYLQDTNRWAANARDFLNPTTLSTAAASLIHTHDQQNGGWGRAPKFPQPMAIDFLLFHSFRGNPTSQRVACQALDVMHKGGLFDVVGGGFHRYSTDSRWLVPHFEKMLYDNALLALAYLHGYLVSGQRQYRQTVEYTLDFILREMRHPLGGFYSSLDADSDGEEGKFYLWDLSQIQSILGDGIEWKILSATYPLPAQGNFEGKIIFRRQFEAADIANKLNIPLEQYNHILDSAHSRLLISRNARSRPLTDDKILVSWNALALRAFAEAGFYLNRADYLVAAQKNATFLLSHLKTDQQLFRSWRDGQAKTNGFLEDYAGLAVALLTLYQFDGNLHWFQCAVNLITDMKTRFEDPLGGFFDSPIKATDVPLLPKYPQDNPIPSGNALAAHALILMDQFMENNPGTHLAREMLATLQQTAAEHPTTFAYWLQVMEIATGPIQQIALIHPQIPSQESLSWLRPPDTPFHPRRILAQSFPGITSGIPAILENRTTIDSRPTAYICQNFYCHQPVNDLDVYRRMLSEGFE